MHKFIKKIKKEIGEGYLLKVYFKEDKHIYNFLKNITNNNISFLEVGSGNGRFLHKIKDIPGLNITCLEISKDLSQKTTRMGFKTVNKNILDNGFGDNTFDIVHCSHIIEHFSYPQVIFFLDEIFRITKEGGYVIIRAPLINPRFFCDIDHRRPYPPEAILGYFKEQQQQKKGKYVIEEAVRYYGRFPFLIYNSNFVLYKILNIIFKFSWIYFNFPFSRKCRYVQIIKKIRKEKIL